MESEILGENPASALFKWKARGGSFARGGADNGTKKDLRYAHEDENKKLFHVPNSYTEIVRCKITKKGMEKSIPFSRF